jgi:hypothetical protein
LYYTLSLSLYFIHNTVNLWGYERLAIGPGKGGYHHPHFFFRENVYEIYKMQRCKIKGVAFSTSSPKSSSVSNKKTISAATDNSSSQQQHQQVLIPAKKKQNIKISSKTAKHKRQPPSSAASVVSQGSSDCELSPITPTIPPKTLTTTAMMMLSTSFPGSNKINGTGASTSTRIAAAISSDYDGSSQSILEDFDLDFDDSEFLSPQVQQQESTSTATTTCINPPQTGDYIDFEGRSYFFLDEIETVELLRNPPTAQAQAPRRVSIQNQVQQQLYQHPCQLQPKQQQYLPSPYVPLRHQHQHVAVPMGMVPPPSSCLPNPSQVVAQVQVRVQAQAQHQTSYLTTMLSEISRRRVSIEMYNSAAASRITYNHVAAAASAAASTSTSITEQHTTKSSSREQQDSDDGDNVTTTENN